MGDERKLQTNPELLESAQKYMRAQLEQNVPDALLTRSWDAFYRVYSDLIRRFVLARGLSGADADDCLQAVWMEVVTRLSNFERPPDRPGLRAWLYSIVRSKVTDLFRSEARRSTVSLEDVSRKGREPGSTALDPVRLMNRQWNRALLETVLAELRGKVSARNYRLLQMRLLEQRDVADVARELRLSPEQVWYRQHRMVKKLRARVALYTGEPIGESTVAPS